LSHRLDKISCFTRKDTISELYTGSWWRIAWSGVNGIRFQKAVWFSAKESESSVQ